MPTDPIQSRAGEEGRLIVRIPYSPDHVAKIKTVVGRRWHQQEKHWTVPRTDRTIAQVLALFPGEPTEVDPSLDALEALRQEKRVRETYSAMLDQLCTALRVRHYVRRTERAYGHWIRRFTKFHHGRRPVEMAEPEINRFLMHLAVTEKVSASTQNQALAALLFLYRHVIKRDVGDLGEFIRARKPERLPVVMAREEVRVVLANLTGDKWLMAWRRSSPEGVPAPTGAGHRLFSQRDSRPRRQGCERLNHHASRIDQGPAPGPSQEGQGRSSTGSRRRVGPCPASTRTRPEVPQRAEGLALAMGLSPGAPMDQSPDEGTRSPSY